MKFDEYLLSTEAAKFIGVSRLTLLNWTKAGKIKAYQHPLNRYNLFKKEDLQALLDQAKLQIKEEHEK
jgi:excisionase family DNA binding protein